MNSNPVGLVSLKGDWDRHTQREGHVKTQGEDSHLYAKERGLKMKPTLLTP